MPAGEYVYLLGGMMDVLTPDSTESSEERISRAVREQNERAHAAAKRRMRDW